MTVAPLIASLLHNTGNPQCVAKHLPPCPSLTLFPTMYTVQCLMLFVVFALSALTWGIAESAPHKLLEPQLFVEGRRWPPFRPTLPKSSSVAPSMPYAAHSVVPGLVQNRGDNQQMDRLQRTRVTVISPDLSPRSEPQFVVDAQRVIWCSGLATVGSVLVWLCFHFRRGKLAAFRCRPQLMAKFQSVSMIAFGGRAEKVQAEMDELAALRRKHYELGFNDGCEACDCDDVRMSGFHAGYACAEYESESEIPHLSERLIDEFEEQLEDMEIDSGEVQQSEYSKGYKDGIGSTVEHTWWQYYRQGYDHVMR